MHKALERNMPSPCSQVSARDTILIVGADGMIGSKLGELATRSGIRWRGTSRRVGAQWQLDLKMHPDSWQIPASTKIAIICAGRAKLEDCEANPDETRAINFTAMLELAGRLKSVGSRVVYLSTNQVFDIDYTALADESTPVSPANEYGRQKAAVEAAILAFSPKNIVIRLTKVLSTDHGILKEWINCIADGQIITAYDNLYCSPILLNDAGRQILDIAMNRNGGIYHLCSSNSISYYQLAKSLLLKMNADLNLIKCAHLQTTKGTQSVQLRSLKTSPLSNGFWCSAPSV
jgi:dTDP-4-dehydrorhamnose reductase